MNFLVLILVSIVIIAATSRVEKIVSLVVGLFTNKKIRSKLMASTLLGIVAGVALRIGLVHSVLELTSLDVVLQPEFMYVDIAFTCIGLGVGSGFFVQIFEDFKENIKIKDKVVVIENSKNEKVVVVDNSKDDKIVVIKEGES